MWWWTTLRWSPRCGKPPTTTPGARRVSWWQTSPGGRSTFLFLSCGAPYSSPSSFPLRSLTPCVPPTAPPPTQNNPLLFSGWRFDPKLLAVSWDAFHWGAVSDLLLMATLPPLCLPLVALPCVLIVWMLALCKHSFTHNYTELESVYYYFVRQSHTIGTT